MTIYLFIFLALLLTTAGQLLQKLATRRVVTGKGKSGFLSQIMRFRETWLAILSLSAGMLIWLVVLYHMDVSKATPFLSLGFLLITLVSHYHLREFVSPQRWLGVLLITLGLWLVSLS